MEYLHSLLVFALFEDVLLSCCETAGYVRFALFTSGYGYSPPSATTLVREDNRLKMCLLSTCKSSVNNIPHNENKRWVQEDMTLGVGGRGTETTVLLWFASLLGMQIKVGWFARPFTPLSHGEGEAVRQHGAGEGPGVGPLHFLNKEIFFW